jgi:hypothetical protein
VKILDLGMVVTQFCGFYFFAVFSAISGLELSMSKEQHKCKFLLEEIKNYFCFQILFLLNF